MDIDRQELLEQGFVILRGVVPGGELSRMRESCERLLERQKEIWRQERNPGDPPGGEWELAKQPRVSIDKVVDESTAHVVDFCLGETTMGVSRQLLGAPAASPGMLAMLCSPRSGWDARAGIATSPLPAWRRCAASRKTCSPTARPSCSGTPPSTTTTCCGWCPGATGAATQRRRTRSGASTPGRRCPAASRSSSRPATGSPTAT